jgi:hypothetical protein
MHILNKIFTLSVAIVSCLSVSAQQSPWQNCRRKFEVSGTVVNAATGMPVQGVRLTCKIFAASITDSVGNFSIKLPNDLGVLLVEGEGYQSKEVAVSGKHHLKIVMYEDGFFFLF